LAVRVVPVAALPRLVRIVAIDILALPVAVLVALIRLIGFLLTVLVRILIGVLAWVRTLILLVSHCSVLLIFIITCERAWPTRNNNRATAKEFSSH
jgi:hypothetical protein